MLVLAPTFSDGSPALGLRLLAHFRRQIFRFQRTCGPHRLRFLKKSRRGRNITKIEPAFATRLFKALGFLWEVGVGGGFGCRWARPLPLEAQVRLVG